VEIKPILYVPTNDEGIMTKEMEAAVLQPVLGKAWSDLSARYSNLHDSCCQVHTIGGKICSAVVSITNDIASKICSTPVQPDQPENLKAITKFCAFQLVKILVDNQFSWDSIKVRL
jgi:diphthine-ammonia ligase